MECEFAGNKKAGEIFFEVLAGITNDPVPVPLICFYKLKRALLRTYLVIRHITEPEYKNDAQWVKKAQAYLHLAQQYEKAMGLRNKD